MPRRKKVKGPKRVSYQLIDRDSIAGAPLYKMLRELVSAHHSHIRDAKIALAWCLSWKPDRDGRVTLGKCRKASDLDRECAPFDFVILLNKSWWERAVDVKRADGRVLSVDEQRRALMDHELCHAGVTLDERSGEPVTDERGRQVYRIVKHDIEEFGAIAERYGTWKRDIELFAQALNRAAREPWKACDTCRDTSNPGWIAGEGGKLKRCACWTNWQRNFEEAKAV